MKLFALPAVLALLFAGSFAREARAQGPAPTLYRLDLQSNYAEGCFDFCACPVWMTEDLGGTMRLTYESSDPGGFDHYTVDRVNWLIRAGGQERRVTGSGTYLVGGEFAYLQHLELDLSIDGEPAAHYDGDYSSAASFPVIDLVIQQPGPICFNHVFAIHASPVPQNEIAPYVLGRSAYLQGCFGVCLCVLEFWRANGNFAVVALPNEDPLRRDYALVDVEWQTLPLPAAHSFFGQGIYTLSLGDGTHRLGLVLTDDQGVESYFRSEYVPGGSTFPHIDVDVHVSDFWCYDQLFKVHGKPQ